MRIAIMALAWLALAAPCLAQPGPPAFQAIAPGVWFMPGEIRPNRQPDGATVIFDARPGLVVMDTGRHAWRRQAILDFAATRPGGIVAIVNSHWHLDHVSGNPDLKAAYPRARVYASRAIDEALTGFLARSAADSRKYLEPGKLPPDTLEDLRNDMATIAHGEALKPDVAVTRSADVRFGKRRLRLNLAPNAATAGDVWVYDPESRVAAVGDLVTLPAPFLDTACPDGWRRALGEIWATPFETALPGHGAPMTRARFAAYREAFEALIDCSKGTDAKAICATAWVERVGPLLGADPADRRRAQGMTEYYVQDVLRAHGGRSADCKAGGAS